ncbi:cytochrome P450 [Kitasatospora sp. NPDC085879]|uniref:cytochrome P450 n=1 Tax=Kitasatospora sp. NPDC085879 TaxID=3154769 RepID=UPI0034232BC7
MTATPPATPVRIHGPEHDADPRRSYELLRLQGPVGLAEISPGVVVHLVTDYRAALDLLHDTDTWSKDTRPWMDQVPQDSPIMPHVQWRPSLFFADGTQHAHLRSVITDSFSLLDPHDVRDLTFRYADTLLERFARDGEVDLVAQYAKQLPLMVFNALFGMPDEYAPRLLKALSGMVSSDPEQMAEGAQSLNEYLTSLYAAKVQQRGHDLTSWFIDHPNGLTPEDVLQQVIIVLGAGNEPLTNLIASTLARMLSDDRYFGSLTTGSLPIQHAIDEALWNDSPLANYSLHFPRYEVEFYGAVIPAGAPVMVSYAAANSCPHSNPPNQDHRSGNKAHLAFAAGPHACPARSTAVLVATAAIERLTAYLPDIKLAVPAAELTYGGGPIYRSLTALPTRFTPLHPAQTRHHESPSRQRTSGSSKPAAPVPDPLPA